MRTFFKLSSAVVASALISGVAGAQVTANMTATTTITSSLAVTAAAGVTGTLRFGNLVQGAGATVIAASNANAGRFEVTGVAASPLTINYTALPATLTGPGGQTLAVGSYEACYLQTNANAGCTSQAITTGAPMTGSPALSAGGVGFVFVGATLGAVNAAQTLGTYNGTITISITSP
jgi:hypothetical protein